VDACASLHSLVFSAPALGKRTVQQDLWAGTKAVDFGVTTTQNLGSSLVAENTRMWAAQSGTPHRETMFQSTAVAGALAAAVAAARAPGATKAVRTRRDARAEGGDAATVGRKVTGDFSRECEKGYRRMDFRHPLPYTVRLRSLEEARSQETCGQGNEGTVEQGARCEVFLEGKAPARDAGRLRADGLR
jgi:hypothetical protein